VQGQRGGHSARLYDEDAKAARELLNWPYGNFEIPNNVLSGWRGFGARNQDAYEGWKARVAALPAEKRAEFERIMRGELPAGWAKVLEDFKRKSIDFDDYPGGIQISAAINQVLAEAVPERMVVCADLEGPTGHKGPFEAFTKSNRSGSYVHCGVREHLMGSMANGMAAHGGVLPLSVTYLAFSDYERPAMRMAALMGLRVKFVFSHDSIGVGKNGPTHQPVEILSSLRAMPNMLVMRPADATEVAECWETAMAHRSGPVSLVFARQALPRVRQVYTVENLSQKGGYVLSEASGSRREVTLLATGSEVAIALEAQKRLEAFGVATAVVSLPCWELFDLQGAEYKNTVLGKDGVRIGIEAAVRFGWDQYLGIDGGFVGMKGFGASGPVDALYRLFNITPDAVVLEARRLLETAGTK
jgi:transketolase